MTVNLLIPDLRQRLYDRGINQAELARRLGLHSSIVNLWSAGKRNIPLHRLAAVAAILNCTIEDLGLGPKPTPRVELSVARPVRRHHRPVEPTKTAYTWVCLLAGHQGEEYRLTVAQARRVTDAGLCRFCEVCGSFCYLRDDSVGLVGTGIPRHRGYVQRSAYLA